MVLVVPVAHQAIVRADLHDEVLVDVVHARASVVVLVALGQGHGDGDDFNI